MNVQLGCMPRPWNKFTGEEALAGIAAAGFTSYGALGHRELQIDGTTPPEQADAIAARIRDHGLEPRVVYSATPLAGPEDDALAHIKRLIDNAKRTGIGVLIEGGTSKPDLFEKYFAVMRRAAAYAQEQGVTIAMKPHGGLSTTSEDTLRAIQTVNHPGFRLCFDPGNLLYYAGERPEQALPQLAPLAVAMCIKDETGGNGPQRSVNVTPGDGDVDFPAVFKILKDHGFEGKPAIIETLGGETLDEVNGEAKRAHQYLTEVLAST
jgi:sugar phosphate isomerase/epimerase